MLERFKARDLVKARGKQRTDSTHILAAVHDLHLLELVAETLRATLDDLAAVVPDWLRKVAQPVWFKRYGCRIEDYRLPKRRNECEALAIETGRDGFTLLDALMAPDAPVAARQQPMVGTLRDVWRIHYAREGDGPPRWRAEPSCRPWASGCNHPMIRRRITARSGRWNGQAIRCT
jgi:transposase